MVEQRPNSTSPKKLVGKVLLVEDDVKLGKWLQSKLQQSGLTSVLASTLNEAIELFTKQLFHAVVTDIYLGENPDGLEVVKQVERTGTPVIVMSSAADLKIAKESMNHGAAYLFEKPFEPEELIKILNRLWEEPKGLQALIERFLDIHNLTPKEKEVARMILKGLSNKEVANMESNTERTIKFHLTSIFEKCRVKSRTELFNAIFPS